MAISSAASAQSSWITVGEDALVQLRQEGHRVTIRANRAAQPGGQGPSENIYLLEVIPRDLPQIAATLHRKLRHCGGFMYHASKAEALRRLDASPPAQEATRPAYLITNQATLAPMLAQMDEACFAQTIIKLSSFVNRYYSSVHGIEASNWLRDTWQEMRRTIKLIGYAAEKVGLRGSQDIARDFRKNKVNVVGVLQLDMTNYKGSARDIYLISDFTDPLQNQFLGKLVAAYLPDVTVGADRCGYACSDHAAWHGEGFATSMPFEAALGQDNPTIHSKNDTYANSGNQAAHALKFTRLAAAFAVELGSEP